MSRAVSRRFPAFKRAAGSVSRGVDAAATSFHFAAAA